MKREEIIKALEDGKKVRSNSWGKSEWVEKYDDDILIDESDITHHFYEIWDERFVWSLFQEPEM